MRLAIFGAGMVIAASINPGDFIFYNLKIHARKTDVFG